MRFRKALAVAPLAAIALVGAPAGAAQAETAGTAPSAAAVQAADSPAVTVHLDDGANGFQVGRAISAIDEDNRGEFVRRAVDEAFQASGGRYNVIMMNLSQGYEERLEAKRLYANVRWGSINYGLWIAEAGEFTNTGDGGYINWAMKGWFDRDGMTVRFHRP
ncbi:stress protein [Streptomonospora sp. PA3]|uniref:stress protein n=1 Tax=Streptomonospora sp. PA3 TaxID=2607326 RepID=UPI0012DD8D2F|nr:stress protein [Streptomonospora sp. PA3]MUL43234.1 stress protein [Streptomonospora sp. PA3]